MVIYEALAARTPLVCSDHPAFRDRIGVGTASLTFPERRPIELADMVVRLLSNPSLYADMSRASSDVWNRIQCPVKYGDLIERWLVGGADTDNWLSQNSLSRLDLTRA